MDTKTLCGNRWFGAVLGRTSTAELSDIVESSDSVTSPLNIM